MGIHCFDVEAMRGFYTRVMGMQVTDEGVAPINGRETRLVFLSTDPRGTISWCWWTGGGRRRGTCC